MKLEKYFEKRQRTYPQDVKGHFRRIKNIANYILLSIYLLSPFLRWHRGENSPDQAILIDIPNSRAYFFFIEIWPEEVYYLTGILIFAAIALFFITSLFGRIWCGYSCPQTVWTDIFIKVERFFQGDRNQRIILDRKTKSLNKFLRKFATHITWIVIGLITGFGFTSYFNDSFALVKQLINFELSYAVLCWIIGISGATYVMAGFAREQVCNYMCPYARFQGAMFDKDTLIISYDEFRGEKRSKYKKGDNFDDRGHCIDCKQCVVVCPQNIDIRDGLQMECIACGLCIDACDEVMNKVGLPTGLIKYDTTSEHETHKPHQSILKHLLRPRTFLYSAILIVTGLLILLGLTFKSDLKLNIIADRNPVFVTLSNGDIRNGYMIKIQNKKYQEESYRLEVSGIKGLSAQVMEREYLNINSLKIPADDIGSFKIYVTAPRQNLDSKHAKITITITNNKDGSSIENEAVFMH